jgi:hypothetical protein
MGRSVGDLCALNTTSEALLLLLKMMLSTFQREREENDDDDDEVNEDCKHPCGSGKRIVGRFMWEISLHATSRSNSRSAFGIRLPGFECKQALSIHNFCIRNVLRMRDEEAEEEESSECEQIRLCEWHKRLRLRLAAAGRSCQQFESSLVVLQIIRI